MIWGVIPNLYLNKTLVNGGQCNNFSMFVQDFNH